MIKDHNDKPSPDLDEDDLEPFRESAVGTNDPNIVGDATAFDKPPGHDPDVDEAIE